MELIDPKGLTDRFMEEWKSSSPYISAHTSGSTGKPKEIRLPKSDMIVSAKATCDFFGIGRDSLLYMPLSADYIAGKMMIVRAIVSGATLQVVTPTSEPLSEKPVGPVDLLPIVPAQIDKFLSSHYKDTVRNIIIGGAPLSPEQEEAMRRSGVKAFATYGMTETCSHVALRPLSEKVDYYQAMPGIIFSQDSRGCLVIESAEYTWKCLVTNDIVRLIDDCRFVWLGRADNVINSGGVKMMPEEIERLFASSIGGRSFYITSRPSQRWGEELVIVVEGEDGVGEEILSVLRSRFPHKIVPKAVYMVKEMTRTASGKIIRKKMQ